MDETPIAEQEVAVDAAAEASHEDPVKKELERVQNQKPTKLERLRFARNKIDEQLSEFDEEAGTPKAPEGADDEPLTIGKFKELQKSEGKKRAIEIADSIEDENERQLTKHYLETKIVPSGNAEEDVRTARAIVNSIRNTQIAEEMSRKPQAKSTPSSPGAPAKREQAFEPTATERIFMSPPYNMSKDDIIKARQATEEQE